MVFLLLCIATVTGAQAVPANPRVARIAQPDGRSFQAVMRGDEFQGWMETADGYTFVKNATSGFYEYALQNAQGKLIPSGIVVDEGLRSQQAGLGQLPPK